MSVNHSTRPLDLVTSSISFMLIGCLSRISMACLVSNGKAAPTMIFIPPETIKRKVELLRLHMPGVNLYTVLKGMPTVLARSSTTVPRGLSALREVRSGSAGNSWVLLGRLHTVSTLGLHSTEERSLPTRCSDARMWPGARSVTTRFKTQVLVCKATSQG